MDYGLTLSSLALYGDWPHDPGDPKHGPQKCPRSDGWHLLSLSTGHTIPAYCDANFCDYCAPRRAAIVAKCISLAMPERAVRLSQLSGDWQTDRRMMRRTAEYIRRTGRKWEWAFHIEANPKGTGFHAHAWQHGDYIDQAQLQEISHRAGHGIPYIERMKQQTGRGSSVRYGLKGVSYGMKLDDLDRYLDLNGSRLVHGSRGFWRDGDTGERLTLEGAREQVRTKGDDEGPWVLRGDL